jgi:hypothetical protein
MTLYFLVKYMHVGALVKTGPAIVRMIVALLTPENR